MRDPELRPILEAMHHVFRNLSMGNPDGNNAVVKLASALRTYLDQPASSAKPRTVDELMADLHELAQLVSRRDEPSEQRGPERRPQQGRAASNEQKP